MVKIIEGSSAVAPWLNYKVVDTEVRPEIVPVYDESGKLVQHSESGQCVLVERLIGYGETKEAAMAMARKTENDKKKGKS